MKVVKNLDEREKALYYKYRNQTLSLVFSEIIVGIILYQIFHFDKYYLQLFLIIMIMIPAVFYSVMRLRICPPERENLVSMSFVSIIWTIYYIYNNYDFALLCVSTLPAWGVTAYAFYKWRKNISSNE